MNHQAKTINQALLEAMNTYSDRNCFTVKAQGHYQAITYWQLSTLIYPLTNYFMSQGIAQGERVALIMNNSVEWMAAYIACLLCGGVAVPLRTSTPVASLRLMLQDCGARLAIVEHTDQAQPLLKSGPQTLIVLADETEPGLLSLGHVLSNNLPSPEEYHHLRHCAHNVEPQAPASIFYLPRNSGVSRGAVFDQGQMLAAIHHIAAWFPLDEEDLAFTPMPWSYNFSLLTALHYFLAGVGNALAESEETMFQDMEQTSPTVSLNMPYSLELFHIKIMDEIAGQPESSQEVFQWAVAKGKEYRAAAPDIPPTLRQEYARADMTFFNQIRGYLGGRVRRLYSAGAPLSRELAEFFAAIGLPTFTVYSVTRAGGFPAINRPQAYRYGSCGQPAPGFEIHIADDGEVLVRGETVMRQYWQKPAETRLVVDEEGWLHSGDLGYLDEDGYLYLTGRKDPIIVLSTGRKINPATIEQALMSSPFIAQAALFGEGKPYISALIVPDLEALSTQFDDDDEEQEEEETPTPETGLAATTTLWFWRQENDDSDLMTTHAHPNVKALLDKAIEEVNSQLDRWEQIREYNLLEQALSKSAQELAELIKIGHHAVLKRYTTEVKTMYPVQPEIKDEVVTRVQVSPERMRALLEKENILDAWLADAGIEFLFELSRDKQINGPSMVHICDTAATIAQMESEEKPLSTAIIVGDPMRIGRHLPPSQIQLLRHDHIRRMRHIMVTLAKMVDGLVLGYLVDTHGYVRGIHKLEVALEESASMLLGPQFRHHAAISEHCDAVVFFVPRGGRQVRVFAGGQLIGRYSNGDWAPENIAQVDQKIAQLAEQKNYNLALVRRVLRCAFQMSEENLGAIFIIGDAELILAHSDAPEISSFALIVSSSMEQLSDQELINFAKQDGATLVDTEGKFRGCMVLLRPDAKTQATVGPGKGARHSSAAKMSAEAHCLAITVSQDGPITIYDSGRRVLSL